MDAAMLAKPVGNTGFGFSGDRKAIAEALRKLADEIEAGVALIQKVHTGSRISTEDFSVRSVFVRYHRRDFPEPPLPSV